MQMALQSGLWTSVKKDLLCFSPTETSLETFPERYPKTLIPYLLASFYITDGLSVVVAC